MNHHSSSAASAAMGTGVNRGLLWSILIVLVAALAYMGYSIQHDVTLSPGLHAGLEWGMYALLISALLIALGFEFVNGFHDTANAVATVIYTHSLKPTVAVVWSGFFNFLGVLFSTGIVAFGIIALLPVELILQVGSGAGFAMVFALLIAAITWNLGTWYFGIPASSSHTLIGSIIGVGLGNALLHGRSLSEGVDWAQVQKIGLALVVSPLAGFILSAILFLLAKKIFSKQPELFREPEGDTPPPTWIRALLILTCTGVSFTHGSNDGQKGMGLIMLILVGVLPMAYGLNHALPQHDVAALSVLSKSVAQELREYDPTSFTQDSRLVLSDYVRTEKLTPQTVPALAATMDKIGEQIETIPDFKKMPADLVTHVRNDMYLTSEVVKKLQKDSNFYAPDQLKEDLAEYKKGSDKATKFIPTWVKILVAIALGLGTMVGWKRIVVTVGEKIGKNHLTYGQGGAAELAAITTIGAADMFGMPVSTTQVLSSGIAGTMAANKSGLQKRTLMNIAIAWILTLPATMLLSCGLYWLFSLMV